MYRSVDKLIIFQLCAIVVYSVSAATTTTSFFISNPSIERCHFQIQRQNDKQNFLVKIHNNAHYTENRALFLTKWENRYPSIRNDRIRTMHSSFRLSALPDHLFNTPFQLLISAEESQGTIEKVLTSDVYRPIFFMGLALTFAGIISTYIVGTLIDYADADEALLGEFNNEKELLEKEVDLNVQQSIEERKQKELEISKKFENPTDDIYNVNNEIKNDLRGVIKNDEAILEKIGKEEKTKKMPVNDFED